MIAPPAIGTTSNIDAILRRLNAIKLKMEPLQPLQDQVAILETAVQDQAAQQHELDSTVNRLVEAQNAQSGARSQRQPRQRQDGDDDGATSGDFPTTAHKLEFLKFDGSGDPLPWLNHCERYFHVRRTPEHQRGFPHDGPQT
jgi:hypothetical protein